jgi:hypothetical protein
MKQSLTEEEALNISIFGQLMTLFSIDNRFYLNKR